MRKIPFIGLLAALMVCGAGNAFAQEETPAKVKVYGFINNYAVFDSRQVDAGTQDLFFFMPKDIKMSGEVDQNAVPSFRMLSLTTRLGVNISGYQIGETKVSGIVEGDFYCMSGSTAIARLRQAYMGILWDNLVLGDLLLNVGQTWHPMAVDMPHVNNVEMGSPFNPFNWSPQIMAHWTVRKFTWTGGILFPMQFLATGPEGKSIDYNRFGMIPEVYLGVSFASGGFLGKAGVDLFTSKPGWVAPTITEVSLDDRTVNYSRLITKKLETRLFAVSPFVFMQYTRGKFQVKAKSILAQAGDHMNLLSGYAPTFNWNRLQLGYTPMQDWASYLSFQYGKKFQFLCMGGYMQRLGTTKKIFGIDDANVRVMWLNNVADIRIQKAFRATPTIAYNLGNLTFSLEYNCTGGFFGEGTYNMGGLFESGHWVLNHRIQQMIKFTF